MKKRFVFVGTMAAMVLTLGLVLIGCGDKDSGDPTSPGGGGNTTTKFDGTWAKGIYKVIISGTGYTIQVSSSNYQKGTFSYNDTTASFTGTHDWFSGSWVTGTYTPSTYAYTLNGNTLTFSLVSAPNEFDTQFVGNWTKQ